MGRIVRRVPADFHLSHPIGETWPGYLNPYYEGHCEKCAACDGYGYSPEAARFHREWYGALYDDANFAPWSTGNERFAPTHPIIWGRAEQNAAEMGRLGAGQIYLYYGDFYFGNDLVVVEAKRLADLYNRSWSHHLSQADVDALVAACRLRDFTHCPRNAEQAAQLAAQATPENPHPYWLDSPNGHTPAAAEINEWSLSGVGHDSLNAWVCIKARCERGGVPNSCSTCSGSGQIWDEQAIPISLYPYPDPAVYLSPEVAADSWTEIEPPSGQAYQLWETVSEGSPITPAFEMPEQLAAHLATFDVWGSTKADYDTWLRFIRGPGWAPSLVSSPETGLVSGVEYLGRETTTDPTIDSVIATDPAVEMKS